MAPLTLLSLPSELLLLLPAHLHNIEDFTNLSSTCRHLHNTLSDTLPKHLLQLATNSAPTFFSPHPSYLVLCIARQLALWTTASPTEHASRETRLITALRSGVSGLLTLALDPTVEGVGLTLPTLRAMHLARFSTINPLSQTLDAMIGSAWYAQPGFWNGGAEDAFTLYADASESTFHLLIYAELFAPTMEQFLLPASRRGPVLGPDVRIEYVKYCVPDWVCSPPGRSDGFRVQATGPYAEREGGERVMGAQTAMAHLLGGAMFRGTLWRRAWRRVLVEVGAEEEGSGWPEEWVREMQKVEWRKPREEEREEDRDGGGGADEAGAGGDGEAGNQAGQSAEAEGNEQEGNGQEDEQEGNGQEDEQEAEVEIDVDDEDAHVGAEEEADDDDGNADSASSSSSSSSSDALSDFSSSEINTTLPPLNHDPSLPWRLTLFLNALTTTCISPSPSHSPALSAFDPIARFKGREEGRPLTLSPEEKARIVDLRDRVLALSDADEPGYVEVGRRRRLRISAAPDLKGEAYWCCAGLWMGL